MQEQTHNTNLYQKIKEKFDLITSNNGKNWLLALNWILLIELFSTVLEYKFIDVSKKFVVYMPSSIQKELLIAIMIVLLIWYSIYNFIYMKKEQFFIFTLYLTICIYLFITDDLSFNLLAHNLNLFELTIDGFGFYLIIQLILKFIIFYLIYKMIVAFRNRNKSI
ncbi:putative membrane protein [Arcobacter venerupis]|uniref:Membrane protein n=1 Tax=Arcobacter venerupis TaxID=1054033 RepID=A0AAE7E3N2_9BACT|nr:hypothetical protein [Arcobacter venerupis]QKF66142.1 putative membrane protein [Arcobacter venerupis]RWS51070.1 hypothetical protein CKA56_01705 [Arcobacter venerupis]